MAEEKAKKKVDSSRKKTGGRKAGIPNKKTFAIEEQLKKMGCDPIEGMAKIAKIAIAAGDLPLAGNMYKELAQYVAPKRKAIEHSGPDGAPIQTETNFNFIPVGSDD